MELYNGPLIVAAEPTWFRPSGRVKSAEPEVTRVLAWLPSWLTGHVISIAVCYLVVPCSSGLRADAACGSHGQHQGRQHCTPPLSALTDPPHAVTASGLLFLFWIYKDYDIKYFSPFLFFECCNTVISQFGNKLNLKLCVVHLCDFMFVVCLTKLKRLQKKRKERKEKEKTFSMSQRIS